MIKIKIRKKRIKMIFVYLIGAILLVTISYFIISKIYNRMNNNAFINSNIIIEYIEKKCLETKSMPDVKNLPERNINWLFIKNKIEIEYNDCNDYKIYYYQKPFGPFHSYKRKEMKWSFEE